MPKMKEQASRIKKLEQQVTNLQVHNLDSIQLRSRIKVLEKALKQMIAGMQLMNPNPLGLPGIALREARAYLEGK